MNLTDRMTLAGRLKLWMTSIVPKIKRWHGSQKPEDPMAHT